MKQWTPEEMRRMAKDADWIGPDIRAMLRHGADLYEALFLATRYITAIESFLGQGLEVEGWHMNGDKELFDNFFDQNRGEFDLSKARAALQRAEGE